MNPRIFLPVLEGKGRVAPDHVQLPQPAKAVNKFLRQTVGKIFLSRISALIG